MNHLNLYIYTIIVILFLSVTSYYIKIKKKTLTKGYSHTLVTCLHEATHTRHKIFRSVETH